MTKTFCDNCGEETKGLKITFEARDVSDYRAPYRELTIKGDFCSLSCVGLIIKNCGHKDPPPMAAPIRHKSATEI